MARSFQEWVHWIELGGGACWVRRWALWAAVVLLSLWVANKQFHGPKSETTLRQAVVGRQLADGHGFTTLVNDPQTAAFLREQHQSWVAGPFPELHSAPLYPALIAGTLKLLPASYRAAVFDLAPSPPNGFLPDYLLLGINVILLWLSAALTYRLGVTLFDEAVGLVAALGLLLSAGIWMEVVAVNGTALSMAVFLLLIQSCVFVERASRVGEISRFWLLAAGVLCGLLFLTDYAAGVVVFPVAAYVWITFAGERLKAMFPVLAGFLALASPWCTYLIAQTDSPVGLAWQEVALKVDQSASDPAVVRATLSTTIPPLDLAKWGNKGLTRLRDIFGQGLWSGGGMFFTAFFVAGFLYRFREERVNTIRALFLVVLVTLILANAFLDSGEGERLPVVFAAPVLLVFGAGFCAVLVASSPTWADHLRWVFAGLLLLQGIPLLHAALEPRRLHFHYPPYYPSLFIGMRDEMTRRGGSNPGWMADVPAGAAWYSGQRVWTQPANLRDFYAIGAEQPMLALVLTPTTLDQPYFSTLARRTDASERRLGEWSQIYSSLATGRPVADFPLSMPQRIADNLYVLIDPNAQPLRRK